MTSPEPLEIINITEQAGRLTEPFTMVDLAAIDDLMLSVFLCQGNLPHHRHLDQDELFLVHSGTISLESDWGPAILRPGDLAVAPKGLGHRSSSLLKSHVLLLQPRLMVNRRNGHRRLFALKDAQRLEKISVPAVGRQISVQYQPVVLAHLDTYAVYLMSCQGTGPGWRANHQDSLVLCYDGQLLLETEAGQVTLETSELVVVAKGTDFHLSSPQGALVLGVQRHKQPGLPLPD